MFQVYCIKQFIINFLNSYRSKYLTFKLKFRSFLKRLGILRPKYKIGDVFFTKHGAYKHKIRYVRMVDGQYFYTSNKKGPWYSESLLEYLKGAVKKSLNPRNGTLKAKKRRKRKS